MLLTLGDPTQNMTMHIILTSTGDNLTIEFVTPNGNQPSSYGNQVYLWQAGDGVPWGESPQQHQAVTGTSRQGSLVFKNLNIGNKPYIIGYAVGGETASWVKYGNVCATAYLPLPDKGDASMKLPAQSEISYFSTKITPQVSGDSVNVEYSVTPGVQPHTNGAWMGLWRNQTNPYLNPNYQKAVPISADDDVSSESFDDVILVSGVTYTVALMMSGWDSINNKPVNQTAIAAVSTFTIS